MDPNAGGAVPLPDSALPDTTSTAPAPGVAPLSPPGLGGTSGATPPPSSTPKRKGKGPSVKALAGIFALSAIMVGSGVLTISLGVFRGDNRQRASDLDLGSFTPPPVYTPATSDKGRAIDVSGTVCADGGEVSQSGKVVFIDVDDEIGYEENITITGDGEFSTKVPPGKYEAYFFPSDSGLPVKAYTEYMSCIAYEGCPGNHQAFLMQFYLGRKYVNVNICDQNWIEREAS